MLEDHYWKFQRGLGAEDLDDLVADDTVPESYREMARLAKQHYLSYICIKRQMEHHVENGDW